MKNMWKNQAGAVILAVILVLFLATTGGGIAFLTVRMVVSGDGNFLKPFEELGWIDSEDSNSSDEKDNNKDDEINKDNSKKTDDKKDKDNSKSKDDEKSKDNSKKTDNEKDKDNLKSKDDEENKDNLKNTNDKKTSSKNSVNKYLVDNSRLSSKAKKSGVQHYYGELSLGEEFGNSNEEYVDLYKLLKAIVNLYAKDGKVIEITFGVDVKEFCEAMFDKTPDAFKSAGMNSAEDLQDMMMSMIETMFDTDDDEYKEYVTKYVEDGSFQLYVTEKGFESLYETYNIEDGQNDVDVFIKALEESLKTKIELVKD